MLSLTESFEQLLLEQDAREMLIRNAIKNKWVVTIRYLGDHVNPGGWRDVEPYCLGITKAGNMALRAFQVKGDSETPHNLPNWRLFRMDRVAYVKTARVPFTKPRPLFNKNGDKTLAQVLLIAKF
jgi:predicted DNA-binding transcriptional regulator YafY